MKRCLSVLLVVLILAGLLAPRLSSADPSVVGTAHAAIPLSLSVAPSAGSPGTRVTLTGAGFPTATVILLRWDGTTVGYGAANSLGRLSAQLTVPATAPAGVHTITAQPLSSSTGVSAPFTVTGGPLPSATPVPATASATPRPTVTSLPPTRVPSPSPTLQPALTASPTPRPTATATSLPPTPTPPAGGCVQTADAQQAETYLFGLLGQDRATNGVGPFTLDTGLSAIARAHSCDLALHNGQSWPGWPHTGSDGSSPFQRMAAGGYSMPPYSTEGENIGWAQGYPSAQAAAAAIDAAMMAEPAGQPNHRGNILNPQFSIVGVGIVELSGWVWITEDFAG